MRMIIDSKKRPVGKIVKLGVILVVLMSMSGFIGCSDKGNQEKKKPKEVQMAEKLLKEKYKEDFVTYAMGGRWGTLTNNTFTVICSPKNNPDLKFKAEIAKDGSYMYDEYVSRKVSAKIEDALSKSFKSTVKDFIIKAGDCSKITDSGNSDISIEEYLKIKKNDGFVIYIVVDKDSLTGISGTALYDSLNSMFLTCSKLDGAIEIYFATNDVLQKTTNYLKENANVDSQFDKLMKGSKSIFTKFKDGVLEMPLEEFKDKFNGI